MSMLRENTVANGLKSPTYFPWKLWSIIESLPFFQKWLYWVGGGGGRWEIFNRNSEKPGIGGMGNFYIFGFKFCTPPPPPPPYFPVISKLSCFFGWIGDHTTFDVLFYLKIYGSTHVSMKIRDTHSPFFKKNKPTCFTHRFIFMGRKIWPPSFFQKFGKLNPPPNWKGGNSNYVLAFSS